MADTLFSDVSEFQCPVTDAYPHEFLSIRSNDGTYPDKNFAKNLAWCKKAVAGHKLTGFIVYVVFRPNWQDTLATLKEQVGTPHRRMAVMIDVESWGGQITGDHSQGINSLREAIIEWLGGNRSRVIGYGNAGDLTAIWPTRKDAQIVLAAYGSNPDFPGKIAHQYANNENTPPFGPCDINSADGLSPQQFAQALGLVDATPATPDDKPRKPKPKHRTWQAIAAFRMRWINRLRARIAHLKGHRK